MDLCGPVGVRALHPNGTHKNMEQPLDLSRRKALKLIAGAPMLPLGGVLAASPLLAACGSDSTSPSATPVARAAFASASFTGMPAPTLADPAAMAKTTV